MVLLNARRIYREDKGTDRILLALEDITDQKQTDEALKSSEARYRRLFETAQDGILILDAETGQISDMNPFLVEMLGYSHEEFLGKKLWEIGPFKNIEASKATFLELQRKGYVRYEDLPFETKDGRHIDVEFVSNVYLVNHKKVIQCNIRDITERKKAEYKIKRLNEDLKHRAIELEAAYKELETYSYSVSHDLRTPLLGINGLSRVLIERYSNHLDAKGQPFLSIMHSSTQKMLELIDDLLTFSRSEHQQMKPSDIDIGELAKGVFEELKSIIPEQTLLLDIKTLPPAHGDQSMIRQVFVNLLSNAIKFTRPKGAGVIEIGCMVKENQNIYYVKDNGVGFDMRYAGKLFGVFQRHHTVDEFEGTGVGLAIVQRIIHRHGGKVWAEGEVNKGATFYFTLPRGEKQDGDYNGGNPLGENNTAGVEDHTRTLMTR